MALKYQHNRGRRSASKAAFLATALLASLLVHLETADAATYMVGGPSGWDYSVAKWESGKKFRAGDVLVFNYDPSLHNVVEVDENEYNRCSTSATSVTRTSGKDRVKLSKGRHFFTCSIPGHCDGGLKIAINAS
ncbi:hypothetical protein NMG60_11034546 [Bertholletia excelsa]